MNATQKAMLDQVADRVTALIFAPETLAERFDEYGCVAAQAWQDAQINLDRTAIIFAENPGDQVDAVVRTLAGFQGALSADDIAIGVPDTHMIPYIQQRLEECDLPFRYGAGIPVIRSSPCRLLHATADFLERGSFAAFTNLVRHPVIDPWLATQGIASGWLAALDEHYSTHLPAHTYGQWLPEDQSPDRLRRALAAMERLLAPLRGEPHHLHQWTDPILELLLQVYGRSGLNTQDDAQRTILVGCEQIQEAVQEHLRVDHSLAPHVSGATALRLVLRTLEDQTIPPRFDQSAIELLGWLELPLDDAEAAIVTGFNEGCVPAAQAEEFFLPDTLRRHLGLLDHARRYARDAYNLAMLAASRSRVALIAGRRSPDNDVLLPSRLLFACDDDRLPSRTVAAFSSHHPDRPQLVSPTMLRPGTAQVNFAIPRPAPLPACQGPVTSMHVTEFRDYLTCPYRYYLRHRLKLQVVNTTAEELDPVAFGNLLHEVLKVFALSTAATSDHAEEIREALYKSLDTRVRQSFGDDPLPEVLLQVEQARRRLDRFADWQADWVRQGWRIERAELLVDGQRSWLLVDGSPMHLRGRIDRIDIHEATRERIVFDYKTGDAVRDPEVAHRRSRQEWVDLQLPLYRHLVKGLGMDDVRLGYILLPKDVDQVGERIVHWTPEELTHAEQVATEVIRNVRLEKFWPPAPGPFPFDDDFASICHTQQLGALAILCAE
ncbi:MAG: PD-(D/E)XK nuclease family protein [Chloroflexi bacterium]|nr:PD-(D/E)XK nuclease family protein [Chloroflexota bacterium]